MLEVVLPIAMCQAAKMRTEQYRLRSKTIRDPKPSEATVESGSAGACELSQYSDPG